MQEKMTLDSLYSGLEPSAQEWVESRTKSVVIWFRIWVLSIIAITFLVLLLVYLNPLNRPIETWVQRSGALLSIVCVVVESLVLVKLKKLVYRSHWANLSCEVYIEKKFGVKVKIALVVTLLLAIFGTAIWGYGDLLFLK